jgi:hypothetical protein
MRLIKFLPHLSIEKPGNFLLRLVEHLSVKNQDVKSRRMAGLIKIPLKRD